MKAITNGPPQWFERLASQAWIRQITRHDHLDFATSARQLSRSVDLCDRSLRLAGPRRVDPTGRPASPAPIVSAPSTIAATGATRSDHTFPYLRAHRGCRPRPPERTGMSQPHGRTVPGTLPLSSTAADLGCARRRRRARSPLRRQVPPPATTDITRAEGTHWPYSDPPARAGVARYVPAP
jgi:hypothetical protein